MLKNIDPILTGELLHILNDMGHGDQLMLVDRNYPAFASGVPVVQLGEVGILRAGKALLSVLPLDSFIEFSLERMEVSDDPSIITDTQRSFIELAQEHEGRQVACGVVPRFDFYERARECFAIVQTLETAPYSCFILHKGVVFDD
jgi:L-fucose mutarotase